VKHCSERHSPRSVTTPESPRERLTGGEAWRIGSAYPNEIARLRLARGAQASVNQCTKRAAESEFAGRVAAVTPPAG
jgi:hypothetical protein